MPNFEKKVKLLGANVPEDIRDLILLYWEANNEYSEMLEEYNELRDARGKAELNKEIQDYKQSLQEADDAICESIDEFLNKSKKDSTFIKAKIAAKGLSDLNNKRFFTPNKDYRFSTVSIKNSLI